ncbi:ABC transporter permease [candidate division FCPU426 bacterium]|nr:ABC transporter permease [candidate division FCPU426 bacterium]
MLFTFAFRNVLRNRRRSLLTALAIFVGAMIVGLAQGWINGLLDLYMENFIVYQTGNVRITTQEFVDRERFVPVDALLLEAERIKKQAAEVPGVQDIEERIRFGILLGHQDATVSAFGMGLDVMRTRMGIKDKVIDGSIANRGIYMGKDLAKKLEVKVGDDLLLATRTSEGGLNGIKLPVAGILNMGIGMYNRKMFFVHLEDAKRLLKIHEGTTELLVFTDQEKQTDAAAAAIQKLIPEGVRAMTYKEQIGPMYSMFATMRYVYVFVEALILFLASFVVINTMMMAIFERLHEIGTLKAIGWTDRELFLNFTLEGTIIGALGGIPGALCGYGFVAVLHITGVNLEAALDAMEGFPIENILHPTISFWVMLSAIVLSIIVPALAAMIPARYAGKLQPAEALRK